MSLARTLVTILGWCLTSQAARRPAGRRSALGQLRIRDEPDHVYARALQAAARLGATITMHNRRTRFFSAQLPHAVVLHVLVTPTRRGGLLDVQGVVPPHAEGYDPGADVDAFLTAFQWPMEEA
jgi:hypothetical protein